MAHPSSVSPTLVVRRSAQSGNKAMTAAYAVVYTDSSDDVWVFTHGYIDLLLMVAGDVVWIRTRKRMVSGGAWTLISEMSYTGVQPISHPIAQIDALVDVFGIEISMRQSAGVLKTFPCEFLYAKVSGSA